MVGCGVGRNHIARGYRKHPDKFRVEALCDVDAVRLQTVGEEFSIPRRTRSFDEILRMDDVDIVDICTPAALHFGQILGGLRPASKSSARSRWSHRSRWSTR